MNAHTPNPRVQEWIDRAKDANILDVAEKAGAILKRSGPENTGPCPSCGGTDRFSVNTVKRTWNCRGGMDEKLSGKSVIDLYMHAQQPISFLDAVEAITGEAKPDGIREEPPEERQEREARAAKQRAKNEAKREQEAKAEEAKHLRDEATIADILARAVPILGTHGAAYLHDGRKLELRKKFLRDILFVKDLDYWGFPDATSADKRHLGTFPAVVAVIRDVVGNVIGISATVLDPVEPKKWVPPWEAHLPKKERRNDPTKIRGDKKGGMIRLGEIGPKLAVGEGFINVLAWHQLGFGEDDTSLAAAVDLYNLSGKWVGTQEHPTRKNPETGKPTPIPSGIPDTGPDGHGAILPAWVKDVTMIGDGDSERIATRRAMVTGYRRWRDEGRAVRVHMAPEPFDFADVLTRHLAGDDVQGLRA